MQCGLGGVLDIRLQVRERDDFVTTFQATAPSKAKLFIKIPIFLIVHDKLSNRILKAKAHVEFSIPFTQTGNAPEFHVCA